MVNFTDLMSNMVDTNPGLVHPRTKQIDRNNLGRLTCSLMLAYLTCSLFCRKFTCISEGRSRKGETAFLGCHLPTFSWKFMRLEHYVALKVSTRMRCVCVAANLIVSS